VKREIWKYPIEPSARTSIVLLMPLGAVVLSVGVQGDNAVLWASVDPSAPERKRYFVVVGTGWEFDDENLSFVGTIQFADGSPSVFHVFERMKP
jgi:hypothetical protein